jgi:hypothetical protein
VDERLRRSFEGLVRSLKHSTLMIGPDQELEIKTGRRIILGFVY